MRLGSPNSIPPGIAISEAGVGSLLLRDQRISLGAKWVDLENIGIAAVVCRIDDDLEVIVQFLADVSSQLRGHDTGGVRIEAGDSKENCGSGVKGSNLRLFGRFLSLKWLSLRERG